jgi:ATP-dependent RNA helicase RhlB
MTDAHLSTTPFNSLPLPAPLMAGVEAAGFTHCTPIQAATLPDALAGEDVAGQAQTGTGKSAAFLLATMARLLAKADPDTNCGPRALILAPTRELAIQIHSDALVLGSKSGLRFGLAYGGTGYESQRKTIEAGIDLLIGTPGRIIDYFKQRIFNLKDIEVVVLDEADRMFDLGFIKDIRFLLRRMPPHDERLNLLFSATLSHRVLELAYEHMNAPKLVRIEPEKVTAERVRQSVYYTANEEKIPLLIGVLGHLDPHRTLIFVNTKRSAERVEAYLIGNGYPTAMLSGDVPQKKRQRLLESFQSGEVQIMVATDVAARGLHIPDVSHVINFDLPQDPEDYVHRIGRTARAGASGDAISFACEEYAFSLPEVEAYIGHKIESFSITGDLLAEPAPPARIERQYRRGKGGEDRSGRGGRRGERGDRPRHARGGEHKRVEQGSTPVDSKSDSSSGEQPGPMKKRRRRRRPSSSPSRPPESP